ncbi:MAG: DUF488 family protein [Firmicutes bacterium]|nr:DUF488 family protein [Bacillota bacterium]
MGIRVKRVYDPPEPDDGLRVLVTYYWPRGVPKTAVDRWYRALGVPPRLLAPWLQDAIDAEAFEQAYLQALQTEEAQSLLQELRRLARSQTVTLLPSVREMERSHLRILERLLEGRPEADR